MTRSGERARRVWKIVPSVILISCTPFSTLLLWHCNALIWVSKCGHLPPPLLHFGSGLLPFWADNFNGFFILVVKFANKTDRNAILWRWIADKTSAKEERVKLFVDLREGCGTCGSGWRSIGGFSPQLREGKRWRKFSLAEVYPLSIRKIDMEVVLEVFALMRFLRLNHKNVINVNKYVWPRRAFFADQECCSVEG